MADTLNCTVLTPEKQAFEGPIVYASLPAWDGLVGIAPDRAPLVLQMDDGVMRLDEPGGQSRHLFVGGGFVQMENNKLIVLANEVREADQIDPQQVEAQMRQAQDRVPTSDQELAEKERQVKRGRAMLMLVQR